jgi:hypothetical protein
MSTKRNKVILAHLAADPRPAHVDPMETFAEVPRVLPTFSTRFGLRMSYVDSAGKQRCLTLEIADLTRIMHSAATALEIVTREQTTVDKIDAAVDAIMNSGASRGRFTDDPGP